ncbi:MAG: sugar-binding protein [Kiritimatiellia bacterium]|jgi:hypothetical protein|nr:sugar-binding protein [Kiritimatiellia bacterium]
MIGPGLRGGNGRVARVFAGAVLLACVGRGAEAVPLPLRLDCGPREQRPVAGFRTLSGGDLYAAERGYGWLKAWGLDHGGNQDKNGVLGSSTGARAHADARPGENDVTFRADLPDGVYEVTVWVGVEAPREGRLGICVAANGRTVLGPPGGGGWGVVTRRTLPAVVEEGVLLLNFYVTGKGGAARLSILGFAIEPVADEARREAVRTAWLTSPAREERPREEVIGGRTYTVVTRRGEGPSLPRAGKTLLPFTRPNPGDILETSVPRRGEEEVRLRAFAAAGEEQAFWFGLHAIRAAGPVTVTCSDLTGEAGVIPAGRIGRFLLTTRPRSLSDRNDKLIAYVADLLDAYAPFALAAGRSRAIYLRVRVPENAAPGVYAGEVAIASGDAERVTLPVTLRILPLALAKPAGKVWHLFSDPNHWIGMSRGAREAEVEDWARHGINSFTVAYPPFDAHYFERDGRIVDAGYGATGDILRHAAKAGMDGPVVIAGTPGIYWRFTGWSVGHNGAAGHTLTAGAEGRALALRHRDAQARSGADQAVAALLQPDATVRLEVRYRMTGAGSASAGLTFMKTHKRDPVPTGRITLPLRATSEWHTVRAMTRVPREAGYGRTGVTFSGGPGVLEIDQVCLTPEGQEGVNLIINPGFERDIARPADQDSVWPEPFMEGFTDAIRALGGAVRRMGFEPWIQGTDEANGSPRERNEMRGARRSGLPTFCNLNPAAVDLMGGDLDVICLYSAFLGNEAACARLLETYRGRGQKLFVIASGTYVGQEFDWMPNRSSVGLSFWKSGADGAGIWTYQRPNGDPFNDLDGEYKDYCLVFPPREPGGAPVPTLGWEGIREGWRDYRYVHTLEQAAARAATQGREAAAGLGRTVLAFIREAAPWFDQTQGNGHDNPAADRLRWLAAWAAMTIGEDAPRNAAAQASASGGRAALELTPLPVAAAEPAAPPLLCPAAAEPPVLDGCLTEAFWAGAAPIGALKHNLNADLPVSQKTEVRVRHDTENLYIGIVCHESAMDGLKEAARERDGNVFADDSIEVFLDTDHDRFTFHQLAFNAAGTRFDQRCAGDNNAGANVFGARYGQQKVRDTAWNGEWSVKTSRHADRWEAEAAIPFRTVGRESDLWGINVCRNRRAGESETSAWRTGGFFHQPQRFGTMLLTGARDGGAGITACEIPPARFGENVARFTVAGGPVRKGFAEVADPAGRVSRFEGAAEGEVFSLPYRLGRDAVSVTWVIENAAGVAHRFFSVTEVGPPVRVTAGRKVLELDAPRGTFEVRLCPSERERAARRFRVTLCGTDGKEIGRTEAARCGEAFRVGIGLEGWGAGLYTLRMALEGPEGSLPIRHDEGVVLVPPFLPSR